MLVLISLVMQRVPVHPLDHLGPELAVPLRPPHNCDLALPLPVVAVPHVVVLVLLLAADIRLIDLNRAFEWHVERQRGGAGEARTKRFSASHPDSS
jgi:hypothetical protein